METASVFPPRRGAGGIEEGRLDEQHEGTARMLALRNRLLGGGDLVESAAEMHGAGAGNLRRAPRDRAVEGPVELEDTWPVAVASEPSRVPVGQAVAGQPQELTRGHVEQRGAGVCDLVERLHPSAGMDLAATRGMPALTKGFS